MTMPNFLIIGAGKSGTTSLYHYLGQHPEVYMSPVKEPKFFAVEGKNLDYRGPYDETSMNRSSITDVRAYRSLFDGVTGEAAIGEASPLYLHSPEAPERINHYIPDAKLIAVLRNPVERAYSAFLQRVQKGHEPLRDFAQALHQEEARTSDNWAPRWQTKGIGFYHAHLTRYYGLFDRGQIMIHLYEDLRTDPLGVAQRTFRFLAVDDAFETDVSLRHNISGVPRSRTLQTLVQAPNPLKAVLKPLLPEGLRRRASVGVQKWNATGELPPFQPEVREGLIELYRPDVLQLEELIGRDLSGWLR
jgi:hypothetical protein